VSAAATAVLWAGFVPVGIIAVALLLTLVGRLSVWRDPPSRHVVVAQFRPEPGVDVTAAAVVLKREDDGAYALLLEEARRGEVTLLRAPNGRGGVTLSVETGGRRILAWQYLHDHCEPLVRAAYDRWTAGDRALRGKPDGYLSGFIALFLILGWAGSWLGGVAAAIIAFATGEPAWGWTQIGLAVVTGVLGIVLAFAVSRAMPLTPAGVAARDHLLGLRDYVDIAELLRLQALQGPRSADGDAAPGVEGDARTERVDIRDPLVPYAVLFASDHGWRRAFDSLTFTNPNRSGAGRFFAG
jgi:hypothetical protein